MSQKYRNLSNKYTYFIVGSLILYNTIKNKWYLKFKRRDVNIFIYCTNPTNILYNNIMYQYIILFIVPIVVIQ